MEKVMSRTYRCKKEKHLLEYNSVLEDRIWDRETFKSYSVKIDPESDEGKKRLAKYHSDNPRCIRNWSGPGWFKNLYCERPYRRDCKKQIRKAMYDDEFEVQIRHKPYREYFY